MERQVLLAPDAIARAAVRWAPDPEARWMLRQSRSVRRSYVVEVLEQEDQELHQQIWMLRQTQEIRESFIEHVLMKRARGAR